MIYTKGLIVFYWYIFAPDKMVKNGKDFNKIHVM